MAIEETNLLGMQEKTWINWKSWRMALIGFIGMILALLVVVLSIGATMSTTYSAEVEIAASEAAATAGVIAKVEYYLPYPGILPDSPLYNLKAIRDRVKLWLTFDEAEKAKLELALADKRINAALALAEGNKPELAVTTATKAEKYLEQSVNRVIKLIKLGRDEKSQLLTLVKAVAKHSELLVGISSKAGDKETKTIEEARMLNKLLGERVGQMMLESQ